MKDFKKYNPPFGKLHFYLLKGFNMVNFPPFNWFIDTWTWRKQANFFSVLKNTWKYKLASAGIVLSENERKIKALKNSHKGERCFIIGNGPSLNSCDLTLLKDEVTFGVNGIYLNEEKMGWAPTYYTVEDIFVAEDRCDEINKYHKPKNKFFGNYLHYCIDPDDKTLLLNIKADYSLYKNFPHFSTDALRYLWVGGTVSYLSMQLAYYMGFNEVYLIGFDHSYDIPEDAEVNQSEIMSNSDDPNHFDPKYFGKGYRWHDPQVDRMEKSYERAKLVFEKNNRNIINATVGGHLEVFPRVDYFTLF
ncbi:MAG: 6-hydroxymethylpterin diphosphokinase MptE-like protein [Bacteroidia bacterium]|jgi:hypothetical protein|uniref:Protein containing DUF115 n=1 Tax=uncultured Flavobacteriia bacterium TaxID=212695 RepID=H6RIK1_9BACT|nr:protein containing DUF115 [uncultured Flavobacteriia bacterium]|tara:strand:+ start:4898 stop:5809 length:912 start_codon:yes stop_codon:yes gene_type:complete